VLRDETSVSLYQCLCFKAHEERIAVSPVLLNAPLLLSPLHSGYGLSLTSFALTANNFPPPPTFTAEPVPSLTLNYTVTVSNTGAVAGDEVVQVRWGK
jgi:hypothetical protein